MAHSRIRALPLAPKRPTGFGRPNSCRVVVERFVYPSAKRRPNPLNAPFRAILPPTRRTPWRSDSLIVQQWGSSRYRGSIHFEPGPFHCPQHAAEPSRSICRSIEIDLHPIDPMTLRFLDVPANNGCSGAMAWSSCGRNERKRRVSAPCGLWAASPCPDEGS